MLEKFNKMLADEFVNQGFIGTYFACSSLLLGLNTYYYFQGEEHLSLFEVLLGSLTLVLLIFFVSVLVEFIYCTIKEKIIKK